MPDFCQIVPTASSAPIGECLPVKITSYTFNEDVFISQLDTSEATHTHLIALTHTQAVMLRDTLNDYIAQANKARLEQWLASIDEVTQGTSLFSDPGPAQDTSPRASPRVPVPGYQSL